jgi:hypothetical protein
MWLVMGLQANSLRKSHVNLYSKYSEKKRVNRLPYGTVKVVVNRTRIVQSILRVNPGIRRFRPSGLAGIEACARGEQRGPSQP